jgi:hypothetical protein
MQPGSQKHSNRYEQIVNQVNVHARRSLVLPLITYEQLASYLVAAQRNTIPVIFVRSEKRATPCSLAEE